MLLRATPNKNCALFSGACVRVSERAVRAWHGLSLSPVAYTRTAGGRKQSERFTCSAPENGEASSRAAESGGWRLLRVGDVLECFQVRAGETDHHRITDHIYCHVGIPEPHASCRKKAEKLHPLPRMRSTRLQLRVQSLSLFLSITL